MIIVWVCKVTVISLHLLLQRSAMFMKFFCVISIHFIVPYFVVYVLSACFELLFQRAVPDYCSYFFLRFTMSSNATSVIDNIRSCVGSSCQATLSRGLRLLTSELKKPQTPQDKAELHRLQSDLVLGPVVGSRPLTRSQKRAQPGVTILGGLLSQSGSSSSHCPPTRTLPPSRPVTPPSSLPSPSAPPQVRGPSPDVPIPDVPAPPPPAPMEPRVRGPALRGKSFC